MRRREFITHSTTLVGLGLVAEAFESCTTTTVTPKPNTNFTIDLTSAANSALNTVGGVLYTQGIYVVHTGQSTYIALSPYCTHQGCGVTYNAGSKQFDCPCHGGKFDLNGNVLSGPPSSPLGQYQVALSGTTLTIKG
jgi:Rieske Fe-S protein